jgi:hypothetical protein
MLPDRASCMCAFVVTPAIKNRSEYVLHMNALPNVSFFLKKKVQKTRGMPILSPGQRHQNFGNRRYQPNTNWSPHA